ncbi:MAG: 8-oxo-dGTP pyrophosphatase MutT (NUDIX family) [Pseudohongiellaceae bacterium]
MMAGMSSSCSLPHDFTARLVAHQPADVSDHPPQRAAVAAVFALHQGQPEVLMMRRSEHPADPWSGHVSFPGGRYETDDGDLLTTALRETHEELGLDLGHHGELLTNLTPVQAVALGVIQSMDITPFVFELVGQPKLVVGHEAQEAFWLPLLPLIDGALDTTYAFRKGSTTRQLPAWDYEGRVIWGLTYRMLCDVLRIAGALPAS